ncbi:MAG: sugar phosphate isomerase/epimerase [Patescibacteria group bacterium]|nr:sugar phosphate isomerase/epimerase [Patescibacteria group bacterium]
MIKYGLKLWSNNYGYFAQAVSLFAEKEFDFIELSHNARMELDLGKLGLLKNLPVTIHNTNDLGFHEFEIGVQQLEIWAKTKQLADYFNSPYIIVHPGRAKDFDSFIRNLQYIDDSRILIENMAGLDLDKKLTFGFNLSELKLVNKTKKICFDLEKAIKSACYQEMDYKEFICRCISELKPFYFHISGGDMNSVLDEHLNLQEANFDLKWIKRELEKISERQDIFLVFETPKNSNLENDVANMRFFREGK